MNHYGSLLTQQKYFKMKNRTMTRTDDLKKSKHSLYSTNYSCTNPVKWLQLIVYK